MTDVKFNFLVLHSNSWNHLTEYKRMKTQSAEAIEYVDCIFAEGKITYYGMSRKWHKTIWWWFSSPEDLGGGCVTNTP